MPCPHCGEHQTLELENLRWPEGRPREAEYACAHCGALIGERHKTWMLEQGEWRATAPGEGRTAGFHLSSLYSPVGWFSWADAAEMYEQAQKAPDLMKGFVNTVYFRQLTAERLVTRIVKGFPRGSWEKESGRRNEALDCRVYARAAAAIYGLDRFEERHWRRMEEALARTVERDDEQPASTRPSVRLPARQVIQSGYMMR